MPNYQNSAPYFDDAQSAIEKDYVQILFRPGYAVQAREVTQLQSLLQSQIANLGDFLFKDGSPVQGGHITFDNTVKSIQLQVSNNSTLSDFAGKLIINPVGPTTVRAVVVAADDTLESNTVAGALVVKYLSGNQFLDGDTIQISTGTQETATLLAANSTNQGSVASINEGVFYVDGYFVFVPQQTIVLDSLSSSPSYRIGLEIDDTIVDESSDSSLLDPAQGSFNYQAPGAARYKYKLNLSKRLLDSIDDSKFFELLRIENGVVTKQVEYPILGNIENVLARRTYDSQGNFTVNPFIVSSIDDQSNANSFILNIGSGKAYVNGFEFETIASVKINNDKARTTNTSTDYDLSMEFGNYVTVANLNSGNVIGFSTDSFGQLDLHLVPSANINTSNAQAYANTKLGTARVRDIEYDGTGTFLVYLLDVNLLPIVVNAASVSANTLSVNLPTNFTSYPNAIANVQLSILSGNSSGDVRTIVSYNSASKIAILDRATTQLIDTSSLLSLNFGVKDVNSLVATPTIGSGNVFATQNSSSGLYPCMDISISGKDVLGNTIIFNSDLNRLDFELPQSFIAQNAFSDVSFMNRKTLPSVTFTSGNTTIGTGSGLDSNEQYTFGFNNSYLTDSIARNNFLVIVRDKQTSNLSNGQVVIFDHGSNPAGNGVYQTDSTHVTIKTITTGNFIGDVLLTVEDTNASVNFRRSKTLVGNTANTVLLATDVPTNGSAVIGTANANSVRIDAANGFVWFTNANYINKVPGVKQSLYVPDVLQIIKIYDSGNASFAPNTTNAVDITSRYLFDSGQRDNYYDHGSIILRDGQTPPAGQTVVMMQFYSHDVTKGFFSADSYSGSDYANGSIPYYSSERFGVVSLRDSIDFRPTRTIGSSANVQSFNLTGLRLPQPDHAMTLTYNFYLPRIDKLVLTRDRQFKLLKGTPAVQPQVPSDTPDAMSIYVITIPPYTAKASDVHLSYIENKRYTMRDIGSIDNRVAQLEYYATLSQLEAAATKQSVLYQDGATPKEQYGIIVDNFNDFSIADNQNPDLLCHIGSGALYPYKRVVPIEFMFTSATGPYKVNDRTYSLNYTETPCVVQNTATHSVSVQPYAFGQFKGDVDLRPSADAWYSDQIVPQIISPPQKPVELPPAPAPRPTVPPSNVGVSTDLNRANLTPSTTTTTVQPSPPPPAGPPQQAAQNTDTVYCYPINTWGFGYG